MAARNGPKRRRRTVEEREPTATTTSSRTVESARPVSLPGARSEKGVAVSGCMWLCDDFVTAFLKPNGAPFSLTDIFSSRSISSC
ncbi:hypothetical protein AVEN_271735-1 [Araneus ventricosus]|uniref:Uncharacterized protein n=1 Tax=Araneus ventricosus TaxID=182803 RepID=A0A4Y2V3M0_ARAVE|nr:hypothetical protein AVEN_271735-1 [Araneus ventricosus]